MTADWNTIHHLDCIQGMQQLPDGSVDLAFADPPFNIGYDYDVYRDSKSHEHYLTWSESWISEVYRVLKSSGTFWLAIGDEYAAELKILSQKMGFTCRSWVIWYYTFGVNCTHKFTRSHAHLFYFVKNPTEFTFRGELLENRIPSARQLVYGDKRANPAGRLPDDTWILRPQDLKDCFSTEEDTWYFPRVAGTFKERAGFHGCQMPEQLLGRIIKFCSHEGEKVLDPFSGSATTLAVAKKMGREFVGFELSENYVQAGLERLNRIETGEPLVGAPEPTMSSPSTWAGRPLRRARKSSLSKAAPTKSLKKVPRAHSTSTRRLGGKNSSVPEQRDSHLPSHFPETGTRKNTEKKTVAKPVASKNVSVKKTSPKKASVKKVPVKKSSQAKVTTKTAVPKKTGAKKTAAKKVVSKKKPTRKTAKKKASKATRKKS